MCCIFACDVISKGLRHFRSGPSRHLEHHVICDPFAKKQAEIKVRWDSELYTKQSMILWLVIISMVVTSHKIYAAAAALSSPTGNTGGKKPAGIRNT